jgi:hypothetical protein
MVSNYNLQRLARHFTNELTTAGTPYVVEMPQRLKVIAAKVKAESEKHRRGSVVNHRKNTNNNAGSTDGTDNHSLPRSTGA